MRGASILAVFVMLAIPGLALPEDLTITPPFTVADSISMTRLVSPNIDWPAFYQPRFQLSPDGKSLAIVTRRGDLATGRTSFKICLFDLGEVRQFVNAKAGSNLPKMTPIVTFETASPSAAIANLRWLQDSTRLLFIARDRDAGGQVFSYDIRSRTLKKLTWHPTNILNFDVDRSGETLVFAAQAFPDWKMRNSHGYVVRSDYIASLAWTDPTYMFEVRHFVMNVTERSSIEIKIPPSKYAESVALAPSGRFALITTHDVQEIPADWLEYEPISNRLRATAQRDATTGEAGRSMSRVIDAGNDAFGRRSEWLSRLLLVDTRTGEAQPLLNTPLAAGGTYFNAAWSNDGERVLLAPAYLPLEGESQHERSRRIRLESIVEVEISTGKVARVSDITPPALLTGIDLSGEETLIAHYSNNGRNPLPSKEFKKHAGEWREIDRLPTMEGGIQFSIQQDMNSAYEIEARDTKTKRVRVITDLNPQLRQRLLGTVKLFDWKDRLGRAFQGGLVLPPRFDPARKYPIVLQTYGFDPHQFLIDGPSGITSAYAARPLAAAGMLVLQMPYREPQNSVGASASASCEKWEDCGENPRWMAMVEGAIDALDAQGLIDRSRVGIIGFSREGMKVFFTLTFSRYSFAAATVADSIVATPFAYALTYGFGYPGMLEFEQDDFIGAPFWGAGIRLWEERSPAFHLDNIKAPLRLEAYGRSIPAFWDSFAQLKRHRRPVEMIHIPRDVHTLQTPWGRLTSQQGNVDWFRFWLLDQEDSDPAKVEQYSRWRRLREERVPNK